MALPTVAALLDALDRRAPFARAASWDPVGLQLGDPRREAARIGVCHEVTDAVLRALDERPVDLLVSYHPLIFEATRRWVAGEGAPGRALALAERRIALVVCHTNFDVAVGGAADALAESMGLEGARPFFPLEAEPAFKVVTFVPAEAADRLLDAVARAGAARIGNYTHCSFRSEGLGSFLAREGTDPVVGLPGALNLESEVRLEFPVAAETLAAVIGALVEAHPYEEPAYDIYPRRPEAGFAGRIGLLSGGLRLRELAGEVERVLGRVPRMCGDLERPLAAMAVVPGAGADAIGETAALGAEVLLTGDVSHHRARAALDRGLALLDPGHTATERPGVLRLLAFTATLGPEVASFLDLDPDPWRAP